MDNNIIERFTTHLKSVLVRAYTLAHELGEGAIEPDHLLLSLVSERGSLGMDLLEKAKVTEEAAKASLLRRIGEAKAPVSPRTAPVTGEGGGVSETLPALSGETKRAIEKAVVAAGAYGHKYVGTEHLLLGMIELENAALNSLLTSLEVDLQNLKDQIGAVMKSTSRFPEVADRFDGGKEDEGGTDFRENDLLAPPAGGRKRAPRQEKNPALDFFAVDLTSAESQKRIDPLVGREKEIGRMIQILSRRNKNNPILLGEPGVGKTAIVEGLAKSIVQGAVPSILRGKRIMSLDLALVVAGTVYRGEFESRLKQIVDEVKAKPDIILFIDEIHNLTGAGSASGSMDAANILKPALARGEIRCIGATTIGEYKKSIESDPALDRRFQPIAVNEPDGAETEAILAGIKSQYESYHSVRIGAEAVEASVKLAERYLHDRNFPDKAIDLLDEASAAARIKAGSSPEDEAVRALEEELVGIRESKEAAVREERFNEAVGLKERETTLAARIKVIRAGLESPARPVAEIGRREIAEVVSMMTGIPVPSILAEGTEELADLESRLAARIVGQDEVLKSVSDQLRRARAGLARSGGPMASFLFLGPSGTGKTSLATAIAKEVFKDEKALVRLDMSEFGESFTVSKMLGSPAGYVGYRETVKLTDTVRRRPYSVVLFDEIEKAHPDVLNVLLQILEDGRLTDSTGKTTDFRQSIVILTSNVGSERLTRAKLGFGPAEDAVGLAADMRRDAKQSFRPELMNRLDKTIVFRKLEPADLGAIIDLGVKDLNASLAGRNVSVALRKGARELLSGRCARSDSGARAVRQILQEEIETPLSEMLLKGRPKRRMTFAVDARNGKLTYNTR